MENDQLKSGKLTKKSDFAGVHVALATPFNSAGEVCFNSLERLVQRQLDAGIDGFVPLGTTGESPTLTADERVEILRFCVATAKRHGKKVIAGCGGNNTKSVIGLVQQAQELGCDAALVITPYYNKPTQEGLVQHFSAVASGASIPILLYHSQPRTNVSITMDTFRKLFDIPRILGVKEASGNHAGWLALAESFGGTKTLLAGDDDMMASFLAMGGQGIISATCNVLPKAFVKMWKAFQAGDLKTVFAIQLQILPLVRAMFTETNPMPIKYALAQLGVCENHLRLPLVPISESTQSLVTKALGQMRELDLL
jgi:4-hydroxy-tetrahydrodipicolinate synthase